MEGGGGEGGKGGGGGVEGAGQTPSIAFRHLPPTLNDFVNLCLEFGGRVEWGGGGGGGQG